MEDKPRVLIATDRAEVLAPLRSSLPTAFEICHATTAEATLERSRLVGPDLVVLDLSMGGGDCDLLRVLSACRGDEWLPVLALARDREAAACALRGGAADAVAPPLDPEETAARAEALVRRKRSQDRLQQRVLELERLSWTDGLTGLGNRRQFDLRLRQEVSRAQRFRDPLSLLLADLDHFKKINDGYGHMVGDEVLCAAAAALAASVRSIDVVCRFGGEEFALLLPRTPLSGALAVAQRVCHAVSQARAAGRDSVRVTVSVGVASLPSEDVQGMEDLLRAADSALYCAKRSGRNCACVWPEPQAFVLPPARPLESARA